MYKLNLYQKNKDSQYRNVSLCKKKKKTNMRSQLVNERDIIIGSDGVLQLGNQILCTIDVDGLRWVIP